MYFSGVDTKVYRVVNKTENELDIVEIQFSSDQSTSPLYNYGKHTYEASMDSSAIIQGSMVLNFTEKSKDLDKDLLEKEQTLIIKMDKDALDLDKDDNLYENKSASKKYTLNQVNIIARTHSIQPTAKNITEVFHFLAKSIE